MTDTGNRRCRTAVGVWQRTPATGGVDDALVRQFPDRASTRMVVATPDGPLRAQGPLLYYIVTKLFIIF